MPDPRHTDAMPGTEGEHQMTVDECIEVAEKNLDGKGRALPEDVMMVPIEAVREYLNRTKGDQ